jgi:DNA-directed RNA polymerase subunit RPC12/RpoP
METNTKIAQHIDKLPCPQCHAPLGYSAEKKAIHCSSCGFSKEIDKSNDFIREQSLQTALQQLTYETPNPEKKVIDCGSCGAKLMIDRKEVSIRCNFCGSSKVNEEAYQEKTIQPQGLIVFQVSKKESVDKFKSWIKKGWFHPNALKKLAALGDIHGLYLPFWTFDADSQTQWSGEAGYYYYVSVTSTENGKTVTKQERRTRWEWKSGQFEHFFNDTLILASKGLNQEIVEKIYPFDLKSLLNHKPELLVGWETEIYSLEVMEGYSQAEKLMNQSNLDKAKDYLGGDTHRGLSVQSQYYNPTFKHILLPVWLCTYQYNGKSYQFAVNGQTGKINGKKPVSTLKVIIFILFILTIIAIIIYAVQSQSTS